MTFSLTDCEPYDAARFVLPLPAGEGWAHRHFRRSYSAANVICAGGGTEITATLYPREREGGNYRDAAQFLKATGRIPAGLRWETAKLPDPTRTVRYTDGACDRYYALRETTAALVELDIAQPPGSPAPPFAEMIAAATVAPTPRPAPPAWESFALPRFRMELPTGWPRQDEHNRPLLAESPNGECVAQAAGVAVSRDEPLYASRQMSRPRYRIEELAPGKNLKSYLVGLKTERHRSSIDGATYATLGEDGVRTRGARGTRLRYQGYSPRGGRGPLEWYHELLLLEVGAASLLITAYCDWIERHHYAPVFAHITQSLAPPR